MTNREQELPPLSVTGASQSTVLPLPSVVLCLTAYRKLAEVGNASLHVEKNRVELQRDAMTEWYVNGPFGLQQGFTLNQFVFRVCNIKAGPY